MERRQRVRKSLALASAALFVATFVLYRSGVIGTLYMSGSKSTFIFVGSGVKPPDAPPADDRVAPPPRVVTSGGPKADTPPVPTPPAKPGD